MDFPAVTVCNLNVMKSSRLVKDSRYHHISGIDERFKKEAENLLKNDEKGLGHRLDLRDDAIHADGAHVGGGTSAVPHFGYPARTDETTSPDQGKRRLDASTFRGVERQIAAMMKKIRRSRKDVGRGSESSISDDRATDETRSTLTKIFPTQRRLSNGNPDGNRHETGRGGDGSTFLDNEESNQLMASEENETLSDKTKFSVATGRRADKTLINPPGDASKSVDRETMTEKDVGRQDVGRHDGNQRIKDAHSVQDQNDDGFVASDESHQAAGFDYENSGFTSVKA